MKDTQATRERLEAGVHIEPNSYCWLWTGSVNDWGYAKIRVDGKQPYGHRVSWELHHGPIPRGLFVCHRCDVPSCVNPAHLFLGTQRDNIRDAARKGRLWPAKLTHCRHGHDFEIHGDTTSGRRVCTICRHRRNTEASARRSLRLKSERAK